MAAVQTIRPYQLRPEKEKVAAYCRTSSDSTDQLHSYRAQIAHYTDLITHNPNWELVDIYADEGISGTSMDKRDAFLRMLEDCRAGKIDRILVKSVSRFARNYIEQLETTRELAELGVVVEFEEQHIDTSKMLGEMQLALHAVAAENESLSISQNTKWSIRKRIDNGTFWGVNAPFGYNFHDGRLEPDPEKAMIVQEIFSRYLAGEGKQAIANDLKERKVMLSPGNSHWNMKVIDYILSNERYIGDRLLQKFIRTESFPPKQIPNRGQERQIYISDSHEAIISREVFAAASILRDRKKDSGHVIRKVDRFKIYCPVCGHPYRKVITSDKVYWTCCYSSSGRERCNAPRVSDKTVRMLWVNAAGKLFNFREHILIKPLALLREMQVKECSGKKLYELDYEISECREKSLSLLKLHNKGFLEDEEFRVENEKLASKQQKLKDERRKKLSSSLIGKTIYSLELLIDELNGFGSIPTEFDFSAFERIVEKIIPIEGRLCFQLRCGISLWEDLP